jgi:hypothetical protein
MSSARDTIIDEYHIVDVIGISSKDPAIALYQLDIFAKLAVANHVANFVIRPISNGAGERDSYEDLSDGNYLQYFQKLSNHAPTLVKHV